MDLRANNRNTNGLAKFMPYGRQPSLKSKKWKNVPLIVSDRYTIIGVPYGTQASLKSKKLKKDVGLTVCDKHTHM